MAESFVRLCWNQIDLFTCKSIWKLVTLTAVKA